MGLLPIPRTAVHGAQRRHDFHHFGKSFRHGLPLYTERGCCFNGVGEQLWLLDGGRTSEENVRCLFLVRNEQRVRWIR